MSSPRHGLAYVVVAKDRANNRLVVGFDQPSTPGLYHREAGLHSLSWAGPPLPPGLHRVCAQARYRTPAGEATVEIAPGGATARLVYADPQRALTPGQVCALYDRDDQVLLGGAVFGAIGPG